MRTSSSKAAGWIAGTVVVAMAILAAGWFFGVSPLLAKAGDTRDQTQAQLDQNALTKTKLGRLKEQFQNKDKLVADLAALRQQIPTAADMANYRREIQGFATARGVTIVSLTVGVAANVAPVAPAAPASDSAADKSSSDAASAADDGTSGSAAHAPTAPTGGPYAIPVAIDVLGHYDAVVGFLGDVQASAKRLVVVNQLTGTAPPPAEANSGKPAITAGDLEVVISGTVFVLQDVPAAKPAAGTGDKGAGVQPTPLPPANGRNPLVTNG